MKEKKTPAETVRGIMQNTNAQGKGRLMMFISICADYCVRHNGSAADVIYSAFTEIINDLPADDVKKVCLLASETAQAAEYQKNVIFLNGYNQKQEG